VKGAEILSAVGNLIVSYFRPLCYNPLLQHFPSLQRRVFKFISAECLLPLSRRLGISDLYSHCRRPDKGFFLKITGAEQARPLSTFFSVTEL
jgi:hypothetical protein